VEQRACILRPKAVIGCKCPVSGMLRKPIFIIYNSRKFVVTSGVKPSLIHQHFVPSFIPLSRKAAGPEQATHSKKASYDQTRVCPHRPPSISIRYFLEGKV
jgi:hypothetical protein